MNATWIGVTSPLPKVSGFLALDLFLISSEKETKKKKVVVDLVVSEKVVEKEQRDK